MFAGDLLGAIQPLYVVGNRMVEPFSAWSVTSRNIFPNILQGVLG
jgi:hypothetical protein